MEKRLRELVGNSDIWLFINSSNAWMKNAEIINIESETVSFRYQHESPTEVKIWEKTTRLDNILEVDVQIASVPKCQEKLQLLKDRFTRLLEQE